MCGREATQCVPAAVLAVRRHGADDGLQVFLLLQAGGVCLRGHCTTRRKHMNKTLSPGSDHLLYTSQKIVKTGQTAELTCSRSIGGLEEAHHPLSVKTCGAQEDSLRPRIPPAHNREAVLPVAARDSLDGRVRDALRNDQQAGVTVTHT